MIESIQEENSKLNAIIWKIKVQNEELLNQNESLKVMILIHTE